MTTTAWHRNNWSMILKNYTGKHRSQILMTRWFLDLLSILLFLAKLQFSNMIAIMEAHYFILSNRKRILEKEKSFRAKQDNLIEYQPSRISIVWQYYIKKKKRFSDLVPNWSPSSKMTSYIHYKSQCQIDYYWWTECQKRGVNKKQTYTWRGNTQLLPQSFRYPKSLVLKKCLYTLNYLFHLWQK